MVFCYISCLDVCSDINKNRKYKRGKVNEHDQLHELKLF